MPEDENKHTLIQDVQVAMSFLNSLSECGMLVCVVCVQGRLNENSLCLAAHHHFLFLQRTFKMQMNKLLAFFHEAVLV
jgi:hypothetical protein